MEKDKDGLITNLTIDGFRVRGELSGHIFMVEINKMTGGLIGSVGVSYVDEKDIKKILESALKTWEIVLQ